MFSKPKSHNGRWKVGMLRIPGLNMSISKWSKFLSLHFLWEHTLLVSFCDLCVLLWFHLNIWSQKNKQKSIFYILLANVAKIVNPRFCVHGGVVVSTFVIGSLLSLQNRVCMFCFVFSTDQQQVSLVLWCEWDCVWLTVSVWPCKGIMAVPHHHLILAI